MSKLYFHGGREKRKKKWAVLEATLAQLKLSWVWARVGAKVDQQPEEKPLEHNKTPLKHL